MILTYLIKSTLCLGILFGFYKIALENKAMHQFKRFYLLASLVFAFTIPLVTFTYTTTPSQEIYDEKWIEDFARGYNAVTPSSSQIEEIETDYTSTIIWSLYGLGVLIFGIRFGLNLVRLKRKINTAQLFEERDFTIALLGKAIVPHSFFKWIFLNKTQYLNQEIAPEVIAHEATHVRQKHSWDILFVEFLQVVFWFNPLVWLSNVSIKLNHEFLADQGALVDKSNIAIYQRILLSYASSAHHTALESSFNYSLTKKRIVMLSQSFSRKKLLVRSLLLIPVLGLCILFFNQGIVAQAIESEHTTLIGQWIDQKTETAFIDIYEENNTLWADLQNEKFSLQKDSKGYYIEDKNFNRGAKFYLSTDTSGNLEFGDREALLIPSSKSIKKFMQGAWYNTSTGSTYIFSTENGITCDVLKKGEKPVRYWPILKDGGVSFTMGYDWVSFKREGQDLMFFDTHKQTYRLQRSQEYTTLNQTDETPSEHINSTTQNPQSYTSQFLEGAKRNGKKPIVIELTNNKIYVNGTYTSIENLRATVDAVTANWSNEDYKDPTRSFLFKGNSVDFLQRAGAEFQKTNLAQINKNIKLENLAAIEQPSPIEEKIRSNTNPKKFFRELGENSLRINGEIVPLKDLAKRIDEKTKNWTEEDFQNQKTGEVLLAEMSFSTRIDENFRIAYKEEMSKSNFYKKVGHYGYSPYFPVSLLDSKYEETLKNENYTIYYNDKKVTFKQLQEKLKGHEYYTSRCYNADKTKTPKAYFEPYIPKSPPANSNLSSPFSANKTEQTSKVKQGDTLVITVDERGQKVVAVRNNSAQGTFIDQPAEDPGVDRTALDTYNRLAKKYTANPNGEIKREEIKTMSAIYKLMNVEQKEKATPYPTIPPPPPVQKESKGKKIGDVNTSAKRQSKTLYANNTASTKSVGVLNEQSAATSGQKTKLFNQNLKQLPKPTRLTILDHLRLMNRHEATFIYEGKAVSFKEVMKLARKDRTLDVISYIDEAHTKTTTYLKDKGWKAFFDKEHKLFRQERVTITYKGKTITEDEAKKLICQKPEKVEIKILSQNKKEIEVELVPKTNDADGLGSTKASTMHFTKTAPIQEQLDTWSNAGFYKIQIDGQSRDNEALKNTEPSAFSKFQINTVENRETGELLYKTVSLWTHDYFDEQERLFKE